MQNDPELSSSIFEIFEMLLHTAGRKEPAPPPAKPPAPPTKPTAPAPRDEIVDRREERGTPYRGDFPNPLGDGRKGCF